VHPIHSVGGGGRSGSEETAIQYKDGAIRDGRETRSPFVHPVSEQRVGPYTGQ
jgi:hypothetical protein